MTRRKRKPPRLPPAWIRRATWVHDPETGGAQFMFPGLSIDDEAHELNRLHDWAEADANARMLGEWMERIEPYQTPGICNCPGCVAGREGRA